MMPHLTTTLLLLFASTTIAASCSGAQQAGYCCNGSIFRKDHNSNDYSADAFICCEGAPGQLNAGPDSPTSCTAGTQIPLTQASSVGGIVGIGVASMTNSPAGSSAASSVASDVSSVASSVSSLIAGITGSPSSAETTDSSSGSATTASSAASGVAQTTNGALGTAVPWVGAVAVAAGGLALAV